MTYLKFYLNLKLLYQFSLHPENEKEQRQRKEVLTVTGKFCIIIFKILQQ